MRLRGTLLRCPHLTPAPPAPRVRLLFSAYVCPVLLALGTYMPTSSHICFALVSHVMCRLSAASRKLSQQCCVNITPPCPRPCKHDVAPPLYIPNIVRSSCNVVTNNSIPPPPLPFYQCGCTVQGTPPHERPHPAATMSTQSSKFVWQIC